MRLAAMLCGAMLLPSCQTIKVQGVAIDRDTQFWLAAITITGAVLLASNADSDSPDKPKCKTLASPPSDKGSEVFCAIPLD